MKNSILITITVVTCLSFLLCNESGDLVRNDGGGTEITGYLVTSDASPAANATVWLINPYTKQTFTTSTDKSGKYIFFQNIPEGCYTLQGIRDSLACIIFNLIYTSPFPVRIDTLKHTGWIHASANIDNSTLRRGIDVYIPGTSFTGKTDSSGVVIFWNVPPGNYEVIFERRGYFSCKDSVQVLAGQVDTAGPVTLNRNLSAPVEIPVPTGLTAVIDTFLGTVTLSWNKIENDIQGYSVRIKDTTIHRYPGDGESRFTINPTFTDTTIFQENPADTISVKHRIYQVCMINANGNSGQWGPSCSLVIKKPVIPPSPSCSLIYVSGNLSVSVFTSVPQLWWIDSLIVYRSFFNDAPVKMITLSKNNQYWHDLVNSIPVFKDSVIPITYTVYSRSIYGKQSSSCSQKSINISNPYQAYQIEKPPKPQGVPPEAEVGKYVITIPPSYSPFPEDNLEYRLLISGDKDSLELFTDWYTIPAIEVSFQKESNYYLQCQYRSRRFPGLLSPLSDTFSLAIHEVHVIPKPSTPSGKSIVDQSSPSSYISFINDTCSNGHHISIRYVVSYQGETVSDSTEWLQVPDKAATIFWTKPGIAYLRAQARCNTNHYILSPWSDALVVTVE